MLPASWIGNPHYTIVDSGIVLCHATLDYCKYQYDAIA